MGTAKNSCICDIRRVKIKIEKYIVAVVVVVPIIDIDIEKLENLTKYDNYSIVDARGPDWRAPRITCVPRAASLTSLIYNVYSFSWQS